MTPLARKLRLTIEAGGPISVADYMRFCLADPEYGYYATRDPFGAAGDFVTAPEVSQMFGEIVGAWLVEAWRRIGAPGSVRLVELGPGRGTLMTDILRVAAKVEGFHAAVAVHLIETSPALRAVQERALAGAGAPIAWHDHLSEVPAGPLLLVANEFFDALPIHQFMFADGAWRERMVGIARDGHFTFGLGIAQFGASALAREGSIAETSPLSAAIMREIGGRIMDHGGAALAIDYGYEGPAFGDTLQAVRLHAFADPLAEPGSADLTAHVDFSALAATARGTGAAVQGPMTQGAFLLSLGLLERARRLGASASEPARESIRLAAARLAGETEMGKLFKVMAVTRPDVLLPPFDADPAGRI